MSRRGRLLFIDDCFDLRAMYGVFARTHGYACDVVPTLADAVMLARERVYSVVVTDLYLSDAVGPQVVDRLLLMQPTASIVVVTGALHLVAEDARIHALLFKPFTLQQLVARIDGAVAAFERRAVDQVAAVDQIGVTAPR